MTSRAPFRTTAQGRADIIEASETLRASMRDRRETWRNSHAPTVPAALEGDPKDHDLAEAFEDPPK